MAQPVYDVLEAILRWAEQYSQLGQMQQSCSETTTFTRVKLAAQRQGQVGPNSCPVSWGRSDLLLTHARWELRRGATFSICWLESQPCWQPQSLHS